MIDEIRGAIVSGRWRPGRRLPVRRELMATYGVSLPTAQRAVCSLMDAGLVEARGPQGTFVAQYPAHLYRVALVFPLRVGGQSRFWLALRMAAERISATTAYHVSIHHSWAPADAPARGSQLEVLNNALGRREYAGAIFVDRDPGIQRMDAGRRRIPRVAIGVGDFGRDVVAVLPDYRQLIPASLAAATHHGASRLGVVAYASLEDRTSAWRAAAAVAGLTLDRPHVLGLAFDQPGWVANAVELMMTQPRHRRPDTLIVADDNLVEAVCEGVGRAVSRGERRPRLIAVANQPCPPAATQAVTWLSFDAVQVIQTALNRIEQMRRGRPVARQTWLAPRTIVTDGPVDSSRNVANKTGARHEA